MSDAHRNIGHTHHVLYVINAAATIITTAAGKKKRNNIGQKHTRTHKVQLHNHTKLEHNAQRETAENAGVTEEDHRDDMQRC